MDTAGDKAEQKQETMETMGDNGRQPGSNKSEAERSRKAEWSSAKQSETGGKQRETTKQSRNRRQREKMGDNEGVEKCRAKQSRAKQRKAG